MNAFLNLIFLLRPAPRHPLMRGEVFLWAASFFGWAKFDCTNDRQLARSRNLSFSGHSFQGIRKFGVEKTILSVDLISAADFDA